jgi:hypothetical protein
MAAVINGRRPTIAMGNSAIFPTLHPSAKAQVDAIERHNNANTEIDGGQPRRLPHALIDVFTVAMEWDGIGETRLKPYPMSWLPRASLARVSA